MAKSQDFGLGWDHKLVNKTNGTTYHASYAVLMMIIAEPYLADTVPSALCLLVAILPGGSVSIPVLEMRKLRFRVTRPAKGCAKPQ